MASQSDAAAAWDAEYTAGRYSCEPPVAFTGDILAAAQQAGLTRGLYIGCGNGRNYLPLVADGLDLTGVDISAAAIAQLAARAPDRADRLVCGDLGKAEVNYEIDAFHDELGVAVEVEAGRGACNNADYRDIVRTSLILDARNMALLMPVCYRFMSGQRQYATRAYERTRNQLDAIYASQRLQLPFDGVLLIGY